MGTRKNSAGTRGGRIQLRENRTKLCLGYCEEMLLLTRRVSATSEPLAAGLARRQRYYIITQLRQQLEFMLLQLYILHTLTCTSARASTK